MGEDQAHEQHEQVIKEDGSLVGHFANTHAILEWAISSPFIIELLNNETVNNDVDDHHHEDNDAYEKTFRSDCESLYAAWSSFGIPFEETHPGLVRQISKQRLCNWQRTIFQI